MQARSSTGSGFTWGELLADQEFTIIDHYIRTEAPALFEHLKHSKQHIADGDHRAYAWIGVHSGSDGAAEADHFAWALEGVNKGLAFLQGDQAAAVNCLRDGFLSFEHDHKFFFENAHS